MKTRLMVSMLFTTFMSFAASAPSRADVVKAGTKPYNRYTVSGNMELVSTSIFNEPSYGEDRVNIDKLRRGTAESLGLRGRMVINEFVGYDMHPKVSLSSTAVLSYDKDDEGNFTRLYLRDCKNRGKEWANRLNLVEIAQAAPAQIPQTFAQSTPAPLAPQIINNNLPPGQTTINNNGAPIPNPLTVNVQGLPPIPIQPGMPSNITITVIQKQERDFAAKFKDIGGGVQGMGIGTGVAAAGILLPGAIENAARERAKAGPNSISNLTNLVNPSLVSTLTGGAQNSTLTGGAQNQNTSQTGSTNSLNGGNNSASSQGGSSSSNAQGGAGGNGGISSSTSQTGPVTVTANGGEGGKGGNGGQVIGSGNSKNDNTANGGVSSSSASSTTENRNTTTSNSDSKSGVSNSGNSQANGGNVSGSGNSKNENSPTAAAGSSSQATGTGNGGQGGQGGTGNGGNSNASTGPVSSGSSSTTENHNNNNPVANGGEGGGGGAGGAGGGGGAGGNASNNNENTANGGQANGGNVNQQPPHNEPQKGGHYQPKSNGNNMMAGNADDLGGDVIPPDSFHGPACTTTQKGCTAGNPDPMRTN